MLLRFWPRWTDAQREAGFEPNKPNAAIPAQAAIQKWVALARELGKVPGQRDCIWKKNQDPSFPYRGVFDRLGSTKQERLTRVRQFCEENSGNEDIVELIDKALATKSNRAEGQLPRENLGSDAYVYLLKSGRFYKIGKSNAAGRREYEVNLQMPEAVKCVHVIRTDDPSGIEAYWHKRFEAKRKKGEWFDLDTHDIQAFKRRKVM
jgi:hypothetical protein